MLSLLGRGAGWTDPDVMNPVALYTADTPRVNG